jgi:hypothetical protein
MSPSEGKTTNDEENPTKKVYLECLVQFLSSANAKKCYSSSHPVLNNRFIRLFQSHFNIKMMSDVFVSNYEQVVERDRQLLSTDIKPPISLFGTKKKKQFNMYADGAVSNKYRRTQAEISSPIKTSTEPLAESTLVPIVEIISEKENDNIPSITVSNNEQETPVVVKAALTEEQIELKKKFESLKALKQQSESIVAKKEALLQVKYTSKSCSYYYEYFSLGSSR